MKTYEEYIQDARTVADCFKFRNKIGFDVAEAMLYDPQFKSLARDRYGVADRQLKFFVADDIFG
jgi:hypothetical protein